MPCTNKTTKVKKKPKIKVRPKPKTKVRPKK